MTMPPAAALADLWPATGLRGSRVALARFGVADLTDAYVRWLNDPQVVRFSNQRFRRHDAASCRAYLDSFGGTSHLFLAVRRLDGGPAVGTMTAYFAPQHGTVDVGIMIGDRAAAGLGLGRDAWCTLVDWLLGQPPVRKVTAGTLACNGPMLGLVRASRMAPDGVRACARRWSKASRRTSSTSGGSAMLDLKEPLAIACHDAGAANIVFAWMQAEPPATGALLLDGPAARLLGAAPTGTRRADSARDLLEGCVTLLSGTGWASELEHDARLEARRRGVRSVAVLDHWVNYRGRFERRGELVLPDEIWVTDPDALAIARAAFPGVPLREQRNLYLAQQVAAIGPPPAGGRPELLYLLEPARDDWGRGLAGEFQALDYFAERFPRLALPGGTVVRLRPHPSDPPGKYSAWAAVNRPFAVEIDASAQLADALRSATWVAGCETYALVVALHSGRTAYCSLPPWAPPCRLPHAGLVHLKHS